MFPSMRAAGVNRRLLTQGVVVPLDPADFEFVSSLVLKRSAIVLEPEKNYLVESRLLPLARREGFASIAELVARMRANSLNGLHQKVVEAMTTNETSFFRDVNPFEALRKVVLPELFQRRGRRAAFADLVRRQFDRAGALHYRTWSCGNISPVMRTGKSASSRPTCPPTFLPERAKAVTASWKSIAVCRRRCS